MKHIYEALDNLKLVEAKEDIQRLVDAVGKDLAQQFIDNRKKFKPPYNDIYYWVKRTPQELQDYLDNFQSNSQKDKEEKENGVEVIYKDDDWKVMKINSYEASSKYGAMTKWCICGTRTYKSGRTGKEYFNQYTNEYGVHIYFYISNKYGKYALVDARNGWCQIFDSDDRTIPSIPNAPSIPQLDSLKPILLTRVYEDDEWVIDRSDNREFRGQYIVANKGDEEDAYKYIAPYGMFVTPTGEQLDCADFCEMSDSHREIFNKYLGTL